MPESSHLRDSQLFGGQWATDEMRAWFTEPSRVRSWLGIVGAIAAAQADIGAVPRPVADEIERVCATLRPDLAEVALRNRSTGHSTTGLLEVVRAAVSTAASGFVGLGLTVQDISDTWTALTIQRTADLLERDLRSLLALLGEGVARYESAPMVGRTHGQPGAPTTFGFKLAQWGAELERHLARLKEGRTRWETVQLGGSVGCMAFWGDRSPALAAALAARMGLGVPLLPWGSSRDCVAEFGQLSVLVSATTAKIGNEVYELQRPEISELQESWRADQIGSVTMPHKQNPERSEHLVTLGRLIRSYASVLTEAAVVEHERDGRAWKAEWVALPDLCCSLTRATSLCVELMSGLVVDQERMRANVLGFGGLVLSEHALRIIAEGSGVEAASRAVRRAASRVRAGTQPSLVAALADAAEPALDAATIERLADLDHAAIGARTLAHSWRVGLDDRIDASGARW
ncbi:lyase family protein [uncultured Nocardioides sp.]|uniref:lyase family protein n=1 Tax=uncultured Nocardioides sp. TaxID=198441 RepID=UPI00261B313D|nr:lyase family protein [uncultured Nocardioides sp.]